MLLKGVIDCPDLPLNVSRSALQNDGFVKKISDYITKKVADKLSGMCKTDKENYEKYWDDISPFIKFGCLRDNKFCDRMNDYILFKDIYDKYQTLPELLVKEEAKEEEGDDTKPEILGADGQPIETEASESEDDSPEDEKDKRKVVYYVTDPKQQGQYISMFKDQEMNAVILDHNIDTSFISQLEQRNEQYRFCRIDGDITETLVDEDSSVEEETKSLSEIFKKYLDKDHLTIKAEKLKDADVASILTVKEESRRMADMMRMYSANGMGMNADMFPQEETLVLNVAHPLVQYILAHDDSDRSEDLCRQLYDLARIQNAPLEPSDMKEFVQRTNRIMMTMTD